MDKILSLLILAISLVHSEEDHQDEMMQEIRKLDDRLTKLEQIVKEMDTTTDSIEITNGHEPKTGLDETDDQDNSTNASSDTATDARQNAVESTNEPKRGSDQTDNATASSIPETKTKKDDNKIMWILLIILIIIICCCICFCWMQNDLSEEETEAKNEPETEEPTATAPQSQAGPFKLSPSRRGSAARDEPLRLSELADNMDGYYPENLNEQKQ